MGTINDAINRLKHLQNELEGLKGKTFKIPIDPDGMIDRQCAKQECRAVFKVNDEDWMNLVDDKKVYCPFCRNEAEASDYLIEIHRNKAIEDLQTSILNVWETGNNFADEIIILKAQNEFQLKVTCESCGTRYAVIGVAYFCPCCGHNSAERTAVDALEMIKNQMANINSFKILYEGKYGKDQAVVFEKYIIEKALVSCISTLQFFCEDKYNSLSEKKAPHNIFQNIVAGNKLWIDLIGYGYTNWITSSQYTELLIYAQRRHLIEHKNGIVDEMYLQRSGDTSYKVGERIIVNDSDVLSLIKTVEEIIIAIKLLK